MVQGKRAKDASFLIVISSIIIYFLPWIDIIGISKGSQILERLAYPFFHANILHLVLNCWLLIQIVFYYQPKWSYLLEAYIVSVFIWPVYWSVPTIGLSGLCFALMGRISMTTARPRYFLVALYISCALGLLIPQINVYVHFFCLTMGTVISLLNYPVTWTR